MFLRVRFDMQKNDISSGVRPRGLESIEKIYSGEMGELPDGAYHVCREYLPYVSELSMVMVHLMWANDPYVYHVHLIP